MQREKDSKLPWANSMAFLVVVCFLLKTLGVRNLVSQSYSLLVLTLVVQKIDAEIKKTCHVFWKSLFILKVFKHKKSRVVQ